MKSDLTSSKPFKLRLLSGAIAVAIGVGVTGCSQSEAQLNIGACEELNQNLGPLVAAVGYTKSSLEAMNLTGYYDKQLLQTQLATIQSLLKDVRKVEGTEKFNTALQAFLRPFGQTIQAIQDNPADRVTFLELQGDMERAAIPMQEICP
jgi:hypothetical protein